MLSLITSLPLAGGVLILFLPKTGERLMKNVAMLFSAASFAVSVALVGMYQIGEGMQFQEVYRWIPGIAINYHMGIDGLSLPLLVLTTLLSLLSVVYSWRIDHRLKEYLFLFLLLETGMLGVFVALDFFLFYIFWEITRVPMFFLIA